MPNDNRVELNLSRNGRGLCTIKLGIDSKLLSRNFKVLIYTILSMPLLFGCETLSCRLWMRQNSGFFNIKLLKNPLSVQDHESWEGQIRFNI